MALTLYEVYEHVVERVELIVGEGIDPTTYNTRELYLIRCVAVNELKDVKDWYVLD